jgi:hypothetical protein
MPVTCIAPISRNLDASPWQHLPEMAENYRAERAGIEAGLRVLEMFHLHGASRLMARGHRAAGISRCTAAVAVVNLRFEIMRAMQ